MLSSQWDRVWEGGQERCCTKGPSTHLPCLRMGSHSPGRQQRCCTMGTYHSPILSVDWIPLPLQCVLGFPTVELMWKECGQKPHFRNEMSARPPRKSIYTKYLFVFRPPPLHFTQREPTMSGAGDLLEPRHCPHLVISPSQVCGNCVDKPAFCHLQTHGESQTWRPVCRPPARRYSWYGFWPFGCDQVPGSSWHSGRTPGPSAGGVTEVTMLLSSMPHFSI